ncbi:hypothetical protein D3C73_1145440 [compost metagenome]
MKFDKKPILNGKFSPDITYLKYKATELKTSKYINDFVSPDSQIIHDIDTLATYINKFDDEKLSLSLNNYKSNFFENNSLIIVAIQESSGSNKNEVSKVVRLNDTKSVDILVKHTSAQIGTADMAMYYLIIEVTKDAIKNIDTVQVKNSDAAYL